MIVDMISLALGALLVADRLGYEERWIKILDLKIVTGLKHQYKLFYGILVYADGDVILTVTCISVIFSICFIFHYKEQFKQGYDLLYISNLLWMRNIYLNVFLQLCYLKMIKFSLSTGMLAFPHLFVLAKCYF